MPVSPLQVVLLCQSVRPRLTERNAVSLTAVLQQSVSYFLTT